MISHLFLSLFARARTYIGQHTVELPSFCRDDRFRSIVAGGGATTRFLAERMIFGRLQGAGLACPLITDARAKGGELIVPDFALSDISAPTVLISDYRKRVIPPEHCVVLVSTTHGTTPDYSY